MASGLKGLSGRGGQEGWRWVGLGLVEYRKDSGGTLKVVVEI
jgi:hypothetical protein